MSETVVEGQVLQRIRLDALEDWWQHQIATVASAAKAGGEWDQTIFRRLVEKAYDQPCGARFCLAGKTADWNGEWVTPDTEIWLIADARDVHAEKELRTKPDGTEVECVTAWDRAMVDLGLTGDEASALFSGLNDVEDARQSFALVRSGALRKLCPSCGQTLFRCIHETTRETCLDDFHVSGL